jgi:hypothetical protein
VARAPVCGTLVFLFVIDRQSRANPRFHHPNVPIPGFAVVVKARSEKESSIRSMKKESSPDFSELKQNDEKDGFSALAETVARKPGNARFSNIKIGSCFRVVIASCAQERDNL